MGNLLTSYLLCSQKTMLNKIIPFLEENMMLTFTNSFLTPQIFMTTTEASLYRITQTYFSGLIFDLDSLCRNAQKDGASDSHFSYYVAYWHLNFQNIKDFSNMTHLSQLLFFSSEWWAAGSDYMIKGEMPIFHSVYL